MKKQIKHNSTGTYLWLLIIGMGLILSFSQPRKYTLTLDERELQALWYVVDNSSADHQTVKAVQALIGQQIQTQTDSLRKSSAPKDSLSSPKTKKP